jgi:hypothetical protein
VDCRPHTMLSHFCYPWRMNKPYGFAASVTPSTEFHEEQPIVLDRIEISVHAGHLEVGYDHEEDEHEARHKTRLLVDAWRARTRVAVEVGFDQAATWKPNSQGGKDMAIPLSDQATATDRLCVTRETTGENGEPVVIKSDTHSILNDIPMTVKALRHKPLEDALRFYSQEGLDPKRPLYGIFKAIESITRPAAASWCSTSSGRWRSLNGTSSGSEPTQGCRQPERAAGCLADPGR